MNRLYLFTFCLLYFIKSNSGTTYICNSNASCGCSTTSTLIIERIVGGETASNDAWGWMLSLQASGTHICGAVLIEHEYALTAAHCIDYGLPLSDLRIVGGTNNIYDITATTQIRQINEIYIHPDFDDTTHINDIAVLYFSSLSISSNSTVQLICLPESNVDPFSVGSNVVAIGWGTTNEYSYNLSPNLQQVTVQALPPTSPNCIQAPIYNSTLQICAGVDGGGKDTCSGDSGGPLMIFVNNTWILAGLTVSGIGCGQADYPGVYTNVAPYISFIEYVITYGKIPGETTSQTTTMLPTTSSKNSARNQKGLLCNSIFFFIICLLIIINI